MIRNALKFNYNMLPIYLGKPFDDLVAISFILSLTLQLRIFLVPFKIPILNLYQSIMISSYLLLKHLASITVEQS